MSQRRACAAELHLDSSAQPALPNDGLCYLCYSSFLPRRVYVQECGG